MKRLACALLATLILAQASVSRPAKAGAFLPAITGAAVVSAFLMASGIYPYISEDGQSFGEWGAKQLQDLADQYAATDPTGDFGLSEFTGFITGKTIAIAKGSWEKLRAFAQWIVSQFSVTDNQTEIKLSTIGDNSLTYLPSAVSWTQTPLYNDGFKAPSNTSANYYFGAANNVPRIYIALVYVSGNTYGDYYLFSNNQPFSSSVYDMVSVVRVDNVSNPSASSLNRIYLTERLFKSSGVSGAENFLAFYSSNGGQVLASRVSEFTGPIFDSQSKCLDYFRSFFRVGVLPSSNAVMVDTTTISIPAELPADTPYGGLTVPDAISGTAPAITDVIEQGVTDRTQPIVKPTVVTLEDVTVDDETGEITDDTPVAITPEDIPYSSAQFQIPSLETVFPFSIPWDIGRIYGALNAEPQRPEFHFTLTFPIVGEFQLDVAIPENIAPQVDAFAAFFRNLILVLLCVWLLYQAKDWVQFS